MKKKCLRCGYDEFQACICDYTGPEAQYNYGGKSRPARELKLYE
jgi:hypothetical protein